MSRNHLNSIHREILERMLSRGKSIRSIAGVLGYSPAGICKEIQRNKNCDGRYVASSAEYKAILRRHKASKIKKKQQPEIIDYIKEKLQALWSPEQISGRMSLEGMVPRVSTSTIYRWLKSDCNWVKKRKVFSGFTQYLRSKSKRRCRKRLKEYSNKFSQSLPRIEEREDDKSFGHWECDLVQGYKRSGYLLTAVERSSSLTFISYCSRKDIACVSSAISSIFEKIPGKYCKSITYDRGKEFFGYKEIEAKFGFKSYFCNPYAPYEKGLNENTNGLLRQYFPKRKDFSEITSEDLLRAVISLNHRPRKKFDYKTTVEILRERGFSEVLTFS